MKYSAQDDEKKNNDLLSIINELPSEEREDYDNFDLDKNNYSYSYSNSFENYFERTSRKDTEDIKEKKSTDINKLIESDNDFDEDFKILDDDILDILNEIQNTEENPTKKLDEDEFHDVAGNMITIFYESNPNHDDDENDDIKIIINSLNNMNKEDRIKTVDLLEQNADNDEKKKNSLYLKIK